ncbi:MAG: DUF1015 domain-containing protein [Bacillota bacterium]|nr:MAG: DUF1015 domain-containing protein [Bacillota bacterium]
MDIKPFRGLRYAAGAGALASLIAPPYDVIDAAERQRLAAQSPYNIVRVDLPDDGYSQAAARLNHWIAAGVLERETCPAFYAYRQTYRGAGGEVLVRWGLMGMVRLAAYGEGVVYPHERTLAKPREDRLQLLRATRTHLSPVFGLHFGATRSLDDLLASVCSGPPAMAVDDRDGVEHRMWVLTDPDVLAAVQAALTPARIVIADGHHRYETALAFRDEERARRGLVPGAAATGAASSGDDAGWNYVLMVLVDLGSRGLTVLPTHRILRAVDGLAADELVRRLATAFALEPVELAGRAPAAALSASLAALGPDPGFAVYTGAGRGWVARLTDRDGWQKATADKPDAWRALDVTVLHGLALPLGAGLDAAAQGSGVYLAYTRDAAEAVAAVDRGEGLAAFLVRPTPPEAVRDIALAGHAMPQKSTYFYPKLLTGLVMAQLDTPVGL